MADQKQTPADQKVEQYSLLILNALNSLFDENSDNYIGMEELSEERNTTHFFHALLNVAPAIVYAEFTSENLNHLELNHLGNKLVFQYTKSDSND